MAEIRENSQKVFHKWKPIEPIDSDSQAYDFGEIDSLQRQWLHIKRQVESSTPDAYKAFTDRLIRRWSIETGIIEGIYDLDRNVTQTLIEKGIATDYIERRSTNKEPAELVQILKDHELASKIVDDWIKHGIPIRKNYIRGLHKQILLSQQTYAATNQAGNSVQVPLRKGEFKSEPNSPTRPDGELHQYCPPAFVESEIDNLLDWYSAYEREGYHPLLLAAWLHHRFEQIHPFQDGNGRVGRAILTWHLVKYKYFPIVISRDDRDAYLNSLEKADAGDLTPLIRLFVRLEINTILHVLDEGEAGPPLTPDIDLVDQILDSIVERSNRRRRLEIEKMRSVNNVAAGLRSLVSRYLSEKSQHIKDRLAVAQIYIDPWTEEGGPDKGNAHWYHSQVLKTANESRHWVNFNEHRYFVKLALNPNLRTAMESPDIVRLVFVVSLHHTGRQLTGVMSSTAFLELEYYDSDTIESADVDNVTFKNCAITPFTFTWNDSVEEVSDRFIRWTEECFSIALRYWMENS